MKCLVSACLLGDNCKYNGGNNFNKKLYEYVKGKEVIKICPEVLANAGTPRVPVEIKEGRLVDKNGKDVHDKYMQGIKLAMNKIASEDIDIVVLQSRSPTCGVKEVYNGSFDKKLVKGQGLFAKALIEKGLNVVDIEDLQVL